MLRIPSLAMLLLVVLSLPRTAQSQVHRCTASDGNLVYTDRKCTDIGAIERTYSSGISGGGGILGRNAYRGCSRSVQDLAYSLGDAIQSSDVNQLASVYDWTGTTTANGYRLMSRLDAIAKRPLVDVQPMYSGGGNPYSYSDVVEFDEDGMIVQRPVAKPRLIGLRVEQTLANGSTPSRTFFGLRKNMGCWWVRF
ncbi:MAG: hypothetical protein M3Q51_07290 [Pseudomonadota bacterium]|nr:hypothetical protein [Pseudomonadota bacterium]MDQ3160815.1 hypothetical protein [Pseudomonadota bacterium]